MREHTDDEIDEPSRGAVKRSLAFCPRSKRAFSLIETAVVLSLVAALLLAFSPIVTGLMSERAGSEAAARREARNLTRHIERDLMRACLRRRAFDVKYLSGFKKEFLILWYNPSEYERYQTGDRCLVYFKSTVAQSKCYTPTWHTMTPAFTLYVYTPGKKKVAEIAVSAYCSVRLTELP